MEERSSNEKINTQTLVIFKIRERADRIRRTREKLRRISPILM
jgi:hypothetical protein